MANEQNVKDMMSYEDVFAHDPFFFDIDKIDDDQFRRNPEFHGYLKLEWPIAGHNEDAFGESANAYEQTELVLWFGMDLLPKLSFYAEIEAEDGFKEFTFEKFEFNRIVVKDLLTLKLGKFIYPFGLERFAEDAPSNELVTSPTPFKRIIPGTYSDNGLEAFGIIPLFSTLQLKYEMALTVGLSGPSRKGEQNFDENNNNKSVGGRLGLAVFPGLEIGGSYSTGKYDDDDKLRMDFAGLDFTYKIGWLKLKGEYLRSYVEGDGINSQSYYREGYYGQISYKYAPEINYFRFLEGAIRFDSVDPNDRITDENDTDRVSVGINYSPMKHFLFKLEYVIENEVTESTENNLLFQTVFSW